MADKARSENIKTPTCVASFTQDLFKRRKRDDGTDGTFGCTLIFDKSADMSAMQKAVQQVIVDTWGEAGLERAKKGMIKLPFLAGDGKEARNKQTGDIHPGLGEGKTFIRCVANYEPVLRYKDPNIPATPEEIYSGCTGFAVINAFAWNNKQNGDGVSFGINYFQRTGDGEKLGGGGGVDPNDWFEKVEGDNAPSETKTGDGAAGLFG